MVIRGFVGKVNVDGNEEQFFRWLVMRLRCSEKLEEKWIEVAGRLEKNNNKIEQNLNWLEESAEPPFFAICSRTYCWWKKSCTTWDV